MLPSPYRGRHARAAVACTGGRTIDRVVQEFAVHATGRGRGPTAVERDHRVFWGEFHGQANRPDLSRQELEKPLIGIGERRKVSRCHHDPQREQAVINEWRREVLACARAAAPLTPTEHQLPGYNVVQLAPALAPVPAVYSPPVAQPIAPARKARLRWRCVQWRPRFRRQTSGNEARMLVSDLLGSAWRNAKPTRTPSARPRRAPPQRHHPRSAKQP